VVATDLSPAAIAVARSNAARHLPGQTLDLVCCDRGTALNWERFDLVVSNPPYVDRALLPSLAREVREHDPHLALFPPGDSLSVIESLLDEGRALGPGAHLVLEIGADQAERVADAAQRLGAWHLVEIRKDWAGHDRNVVVRRRP
jgi:release factor glutamine methyltransferase